jgi:transcriptional regulator with XRE-family HTH domain
MKRPNNVRARRADATDKLIGERIRAARLLAKLSQTQLGERIGVTFQQVQKYEKGVNRIGGGRMARVVEALGKPIEWFYSGEVSNTTKPRGDDPLTELGQTRDGVRLARAFNAIEDGAMRHALVASAEAMAA